MHHSFKRDIRGFLKTIAFVGAVALAFMGLSWLWQHYGRDALTPLLGPVAEKAIEPATRFGAYILHEIQEIFFTYVFLPVVGLIGKVSPQLAGIIMKTRILFTLVVVVVFAIGVAIVEIVLIMTRRLHHN